MNINKNYILAVYVFWREHVGGHRLHTRSSSQGGQETIHGHATGRDQPHEMRAAQGVSGDVNYYQTSICSRRTTHETSGTEDAAATETDVSDDDK